MTSTYKNTNNCLLFLTAKTFLDAVDTVFYFRFVETSNKWVLEFRPINELIWQRKPISIALATNHIEYNKDTEKYHILTNENNIEEDVQILKVYYTLHQLLVEAINQPDLILPEHFVSLSQLWINPPYHFEQQTKFPAWLKQPGQPTIRISNGQYKDNRAFINLSFNNWKYIQLAKREATSKKRKLELEETTDPVSNERQQPMSLNPVTLEEVVEP
jgi:hypothetical protein